MSPTAEEILIAKRIAARSAAWPIHGKDATTNNETVSMPDRAVMNVLAVAYTEAIEALRDLHSLEPDRVGKCLACTALAKAPKENSHEVD